MYVQNKEPLILKRSEAYIGVLIDDLVNLLIDEPYRMFTSRAEYRLLLRQDNADRRLTETGYKLGLATEKAKQRLNKKEEFIAKLRYFVLEKSIAPEEVNEYLKTRSEMPITQKELIGKLVKRSNVKLNELLSLLCHPERSEESIAVFKEDASFAEFMLNEVNVILRSDERKTRLEKEAIEQVEIELKYDGYISRQNSDIEKFEKTESSTIPIEFDYSKVKSLSAEGREKLGRIKPQTLGQASRISGVTPADVSVLMVYLHR
jgi:tRNA uridine 5-carboxymethylaminomethyl modification enzyme